MIIKAGDPSQFLMNRLANCTNKYQRITQYKRVLCVCSAGLLRSPTAAVVLSQAPWSYNTRAAGLTPEFALIPVDQVLLEWSDEIVCMSEDQQDTLKGLLVTFDLTRPVLNLNIPDNYGYRDPSLEAMIKRAYDQLTNSDPGVPQEAHSEVPLLVQPGGNYAIEQCPKNRS